ncbi:hypothetical protein ACHQM5_024906 [Ranunculus cassubicifolius]
MSLYQNLKGHPTMYHCNVVPRVHSQAYSSRMKQQTLPLYTPSCIIQERKSCFTGNKHMLNHSILSLRRIHVRKFQICASIDVAGAVDVINDLGMDTLTFLMVTVIIVPAFKIIKSSPVSFTFFNKPEFFRMILCMWLVASVSGIYWSEF